MTKFCLIDHYFYLSCWSNSSAAGDWVNCGVCGEWAHFGCDRRQGLGAFKVLLWLYCLKLGDLLFINYATESLVEILPCTPTIQVHVATNVCTTAFDFEFV